MVDRDINKANPDLTNTVRKDEEHRDPITGAPGAHPVGTGVGAASAGAAGAAIGAALGPAGSVIGAVVGAVAGGLAGKGVAEAIHPTAEEAYWRDNYRNRPYVTGETDYEDYRPAYEHGWSSAPKYTGRTFDESELEIRRDWEGKPSKSRMEWEHAKHAVRDLFERASDTLRNAAARTSEAVTDKFGDRRSDIDRTDPDRTTSIGGAPGTLGTSNSPNRPISAGTSAAGTIPDLNRPDYPAGGSASSGSSRVGVGGSSRHDLDKGESST